MSSPAPQVPAPSAGAILGRARGRLQVVAPKKSDPARLPFVLLVTSLLIGGVVGLLLFNTSMQQASFTEAKLQDQATNLAAREQTMQMKVERMQDPQRLAVRARRLGLVIPGTPIMLRVPSGRVEGEPLPAGSVATPPLYPTKPVPGQAAEKKGAHR